MFRAWYSTEGCKCKVFKKTQAAGSLVLGEQMSSDIEFTHFIEIHKSLSLGFCRAKTHQPKTLNPNMFIKHRKNTYLIEMLKSLSLGPCRATMQLPKSTRSSDIAFTPKPYEYRYVQHKMGGNHKDTFLILLIAVVGFEWGLFF